MLSLCSLLTSNAGGSSEVASAKPNFLFVLVDDLGRAELGFNRDVKTNEVKTPSIDDLVATGINLDRHYVHKFCSPTRCAIQSGRAPIHVNTINASPDVYNASDPEGGFAGIPRSMTGIAEVLKKADYATHMVGKWDAGMATNEHTPVGRGYDTTLHYFHHSNDYYTFKAESCNKTLVFDLWNKFGPVNETYGRPGKNHLNSNPCTVTHQNPGQGETCKYEDALFESRVHSIIEHHDIKRPLFVFWATHIVHGPLQVPDAQLAKFEFIDNPQRQKYHSMVNYIDGAIGRVVQSLKTKGVYNNTLIIFSADNGGPLGAANNFPLKGGKFSNWEGGIRVAAFVSGGLLPAAVRGTKQTGLMAGWDWYATLAGLAGVDPTDTRAVAHDLPAIDSLDLWPLLSGANKTSPRRRLEIGSNIGGDDYGRTSSGNTLVGGLIIPPYKLLLGDGYNDTLDNAGWPGPQHPNGTAGDAAIAKMRAVCGRTPADGCLFNVYEDEGEHTNLASAMPDVYNKMMTELQEVQATVYSPSRGAKAPAACDAVFNKYNGFWGPFVFTPPPHAKTEANTPSSS